MKTVKPVSKETYAKIGAGYLILAEHPEIFGDVTFRKFCDMFVDDIIDEGEEIIAARKKAYAGEMYDLLRKMRELPDYEDMRFYNIQWEVFTRAVGNLLTHIDRCEEEASGDE